MKYLNHYQAAHVIGIDVGRLYYLLEERHRVGGLTLAYFAIEQAKRKYLFPLDECVKFKRRWNSLPDRYKREIKSSGQDRRI